MSQEKDIDKGGEKSPALLLTVIVFVLAIAFFVLGVV